MFDNDLPGLDALPEADEAGLVAAIGGWAQVEAAAAARRLAAIAELTAWHRDESPWFSRRH